MLIGAIFFLESLPGLPHNGATLCAILTYAAHETSKIKLDNRYGMCYTLSMTKGERSRNEIYSRGQQQEATACGRRRDGPRGPK